MMIKAVKIPKSRLPVLIGKGGATKRLVEKETNTKITADEEIIIEGESLDVMTAENIVKAIGRGFSPRNSKLLLNEDNILVIIDLPKGENALKRIKSRLIGTGGKSRRNVERLTGTRISVYGKTISIIGSYTGAPLAEKAVNKIIKGVPHRIVYEFLEAKQDERS